MEPIHNISWTKIHSCFLFFVTILPPPQLSELWGHPLATLKMEYPAHLKEFPHTNGTYFTEIHELK